VRQGNEQVSVGGRARARGRILQRAALIAGALVVLAVLFLITGHWVLAVIVGAVAALALWAFLQARSVR
jgi:VIT1/CCC1 family predicted Fe2+/Mn2+ transporter